jgi:hypothetical protein
MAIIEEVSRAVMEKKPEPGCRKLAGVARSLFTAKQNNSNSAARAIE